jgi:GNAT superfamily N-acetyltransferase
MAFDTAGLARALPDLPRLVETRAMLLSGRCRLFGSPETGGYVITDGPTALAAAVGRPGADALAQAAADVGEAGAVLSTADDASWVVSALPGWTYEEAVIHLEDAAVPRGGFPSGVVRHADARLIGVDDPLDLRGLPDPLRIELDLARRGSALAVAFADGRAVSFAYAPWQTETLADLSIDTLAGFRGRGFGRAAVECLIPHLRARGKRPVWGALLSNEPSLRMAARLGFRPVDRLAVFARVSPGKGRA